MFMGRGREHGVECELHGGGLWRGVVCGAAAGAGVPAPAGGAVCVDGRGGGGVVSVPRDAQVLDAAAGRDSDAVLHGAHAALPGAPGDGALSAEPADVSRAVLCVGGGAHGAVCSDAAPGAVPGVLWGADAGGGGMLPRAGCAAAGAPAGDRGSAAGAPAAAVCAGAAGGVVWGVECGQPVLPGAAAVAPALRTAAISPVASVPSASSDAVPVTGAPDRG